MIYTEEFEKLRKKSVKTSKKPLKEAFDESVLDSVFIRFKEAFATVDGEISFNLSRSRKVIQVIYTIKNPYDNSLERNKIYSHFSFSLFEDLYNPDMLFEFIKNLITKDIEREIEQMNRDFTLALDTMKEHLKF